MDSVGLPVKPQSLQATTLAAEFVGNTSVDFIYKCLSRIDWGLRGLAERDAFRIVHRPDDHSRCGHGNEPGVSFAGFSRLRFSMSGYSTARMKLRPDS